MLVLRPCSNVTSQTQARRDRRFSRNIVAGVALQAIPYWLKAGHAALQKSHLAEATSSLRKGLELLSGLPDKRDKVELELQLQAALAITLSGSMGLGKPEVTFALASYAMRSAVLLNSFRCSTGFLCSTGLEVTSKRRSGMRKRCLALVRMEVIAPCCS
jgi:hypothetical protein